MKAAIWLVGSMTATALGWLALLSAFSDVVTSNYATIQEARADQLFERGWLPDILPASTRDIRTSNDLDLNTSEGHFSFVPAEYPLFWSRIAPYASMHAPFVDFDEEVRRMQSRGFTPSSFADADSVWVFFCKPEEGCCEYTMWLKSG